MSSEKIFTCDVCHKKIKAGHQEYYMATITIDHMIQIDDGSCAGTESAKCLYHVHNDFSNHCMDKIWDVVERDRK